MHDAQYPAATFANEMQVHPMTIAKGDVVVWKIAGSDMVVGRVTLLYKEDDGFFVILAPWRKVVVNCLRWSLPLFFRAPLFFPLFFRVPKQGAGGEGAYGLGLW